MSRITGSDAKGLMEAYSAVYAPQELTEEQVWEEVENWVNSLLEEGYDLSDYTWEEMYESYLSEMGQTRTTGQNSSVFRLPTTPSAGSAGGSGSGGRRGSGSSPGGVRPAASPAPATPAAPKPAATPAPATPAAPKSAAPAARTPAARPAAPAPASAKVAPTKPTAPTKPAIGMLGKTSFERRTPTSAELKAAQAARASGASPEKALQAAKAVSAPKVAPSNTLSSTVAAASKPAAFSPAPEVKATNTIAAAPKPAPVSPRQQRLNMEMEYDAYDIVLEYLLSEGHVETVEEAHYVMMEMDAETIGTIVEAAKDQSDKQIEKGVKTTYKAGNVLDNTHQGRSPGLNKLPRGEREEKAQRMRGRLKARRDDLFGERNKREDAAREEMKKKYGL
jgi:hypothetical protein